MDGKVELEPPPYASGAASTVARPSAFRTNFASISLHHGDILRMLGFPPEILPKIRNLINSAWPDGVQRETNFGQSREFKLRGYPWNARSEDAVTSRRLINHILAALFEEGWILSLTTDISKRVSDLDTLIFRHQPQPPAPCEWMSVSFSNSDEIRFIYMPEQQPGGIIEGLISALGSQVQARYPHRSVTGCYVIKLYGRPWRAWDSDSMHARTLLLTFLTTLEQFGWTVYASVDEKLQRQGKNSSSGDTDTWHCCKQIGWQPGMPVYHN